MVMGYSSEVVIRAPAAEVFAYIDDIRNVAAHMSAHRSAAMAGSRLAVEIVGRQASGVGAVYRYTGRVLGLVLDFEERVTRYAPPTLKEWQTMGQPRMLILGSYVMTFMVTATAASEARLAVDLRYTLPTARPWRWIGRALAPFYARWCVEAILSGSRQELETAHPKRT